MRKLLSLFCIASFVSISNLSAQPLLNFNTSFQTTDQSIWGPGEAFQWDYAEDSGLPSFFGPDINIPTQVIGAGSGDRINVSIPVPVFSDPTWSINPYFQYRGNFRAGLELGANIDGGSVDANLDYNFGLSAPNIINLGQSFSLTPTIQKLNSSSFQTTAANASAYLDAVIQSRLQTYVRLEVDQPSPLSDQDYRLGNRGFTTRSPHSVPWYTVPGTDIDVRVPIIEINRNESGRLRYIDPFSLPDDDTGYSSIGTGDSVDFGPLSLTAGNWNTNATGSGNELIISGEAEETLVRAELDIDALVLGSEVLGKSLTNNWGVLDYDLGYDILDYTAGLNVGLNQNFNLREDVKVTLDFSAPVMLEGIGVTESYTGLFSGIPEITLLTNSVDVETLFFLDAFLTNQTDITFDGDLTFTFIEAHVDIGYDFGINVAGVGYSRSGTAISESLGPFFQDTQLIDLGSATAFSDEFLLEGFQAISGGSFTLSVIPIPPAVWLFASALIGLAAVSRRKLHFK